jgi:osmotically-inducible protein OsmY
MKSVDFLKALGGVVCVVLACNAYAQSSDAMAASGTMAAPDAKSMKKADRSLGLAVRKALSKGNIDVSSVDVRARGGAVTLTGKVPEGDQIEKAGTVAQGVAGVTSVTNKLTLKEQ